MLRRLLPFALLCFVLLLSAVVPTLNAAPQPTLSAADAEARARAHLLANAAAYGVAPEDLTELRVDLNRADPVTGARYLLFLQTVNDIPIYNAMLNVTLAPDGAVAHVGNRALANVAARASRATPAITGRDAITAVAADLELPYEPVTVNPIAPLTTPKTGTLFSGGTLSLEEIPVALMYQPQPDGTLRLAWDLQIFQRDGRHWWNARVDAATGAVLELEDWAIRDDWGAAPEGSFAPDHVTTLDDAPLRAPDVLTGTYRVYPMPIESPSHSVPPAPADGRTLAVNPAHPTSSPFGWHDIDGVAGAEYTTTQGNNSHAYLDLDANQIPDPGSSPDGGAALLFDFPVDFTQLPSAYRPAVVTNFFYWTNLMHDVSYYYGFNEAARNFQENNYGNGGLGSDYLYAEAQDGSGTNGGIFFAGADGTNPRLQMYVWTLTTPHRDGAFDNGITAHEYGHGISSRMTGNGVSCLGNAEQMGEGWSDWQAVLLTMRPGDTATTNRPMGTYVFGQPPTGTGIRPAPYTTDFAVNDYTYADLPTAGGSHGVGFIWNTMLWEMNWELIAAHGFNPDIFGGHTSGGNTLAYKLVMDGLAIQPCLPGFVDGRNAILSADMILTGGENQCRIWAAFARRGLGFSASQGSPNSTTDGTAAFDLPASCASTTPTPTPSLTPTPTVSATASTTVTPTTTPTATASATVTPSTTPTATATSSATPTATVTVSATPQTPTVTSTATGSPPPTATATPPPPTITVTASSTAIPPTPTATPTKAAGGFKTYLTGVRVLAR